MSLSSLRLALRLARRDAQRTKGRSALVLALLGLPVLTVGFGAAVIDSLQSSDTETAERILGSADAIVQWDYRVPIIQDPLNIEWSQPVDDAAVSEDAYRAETATTAELTAVLPEGARLVEVTSGRTTVTTPDGIDRLRLDGVVMSDPAMTGRYSVLDGDVPTGNEIALSVAAAEFLEVEVGDTLELPDLGREPVVAAIVEEPGDLHAEFAVVPPDTFEGEHVAWYVDTPEGIGWDRVRELNGLGVSVLSAQVVADPPPSPFTQRYGTPDALPAEELMLVTFAVGMVVLEIVLLAGPAFAIGAKRRTREFALLSANGATPAQIRRVVLAGGVVMGGVATFAGIALGVAAARLSLPIVEQLVGRRSTGFGVFPELILPLAAVGVVTGLLAAVVPAFTTARQDVVAAFSGRRGATRSRRRWLLLGLLLVAAGLAAGVAGTLAAQSALLLGGVAFLELGLVLCTPALVGLISRLGRFLPVSPRIALRDAGRNRASAAPAISAVMAVVAMGLAATMFYVGDRARYAADDGGGPPPGTPLVTVYRIGELGVPPTEEAVAATDRAIEDVTGFMTGHLPVTAVHQAHGLECQAAGADAMCVPAAVQPAETACPFDGRYDLDETEQAEAAGNPHCTSRQETSGNTMYGSYRISPEAVAAFTGLTGDALAEAQRVIREGGAIVQDPDLVVDGTVTLEVRDVGPDGTDHEVRESVTVPGFGLSEGKTDTHRTEHVLFSDAAAAALGLRDRGETTLAGTLERTTTRAEENRFDQAIAAAGYTDWMNGTGDDLVQVYPEFVGGDDEPVSVATLPLLVAIVTGILALAATAVATALAAAESRRDLTTLAAIGASPATRRKLSLFQAGVISMIGVTLGVVAGVGASIAAMAALNTRYALAYPLVNLYPMDIPWLNVAVAMVAVPVVAMVGAGLLTRSRLPSERRTG
ncbi:putative ABC transport system permease protein [Stackebrandtia albiflava]|uniref:Putative ABC transport system permease protein n=1 Tax=Stackebrandtia albiflava TaxID=406432 RepID=A0A562VAK1_9ACTN|nr:ABC transporter permease [Stackebrandtia albiflava]TWJ14878.1 putative ABC transport system permease protein [Stackebrandtia albiflava]